MAGFQLSINGRFWVSTEANVAETRGRRGGVRAVFARLNFVLSRACLHKPRRPDTHGGCVLWESWLVAGAAGSAWPLSKPTRPSCCTWTQRLSAPCDV